MHRLLDHLDVATKALVTLAVIAPENNPSEMERDAAIHRFEYTFDALFKAGQVYLSLAEGIEVRSPRRIARACLVSGILDLSQFTLALKMIKDRKLTVRAYDEQLANEIFEHLINYCRLINSWLTAMSNRAPF
ncbi:MAG: nucleotidyltransferase substrate binding protein [Chloroflexi bacterium]|nr:nucleotidyltransferase substrate binding protein [Chloroflexota bacterium]